MKRVISVSLGSSRRDKVVEADFLGEKFQIERRGTDGDLQKACEVIAELDKSGEVAAIGLGGIDLYLIAGPKKYVIKDALKMKNAAKNTPVVDGSGLKNTLERLVVRHLFRDHPDFKPGVKVLLVSAVDRFGMAEALVHEKADVIFGDLIFALGVQRPIRTLSGVSRLAGMLLPVLTRLPFEVLYPTGEKQEKAPTGGAKFARWYRWADVIAGDYHLVRKHLPPRIDGKIILTNTTTEEDVAELAERGAKSLITTTPVLGGRSFGTNVMEGMFVVLSGKRPEDMTSADFEGLLDKLKFEPNVRDLQEG